MSSLLYIWQTLNETSSLLYIWQTLNETSSLLYIWQTLNMITFACTTILYLLVQQRNCKPKEITTLYNVRLTLNRKSCKHNVLAIYTRKTRACIGRQYRKEGQRGRQLLHTVYWTNHAVVFLWQKQHRVLRKGRKYRTRW